MKHMIISGILQEDHLKEIYIGLHRIGIADVPWDQYVSNVAQGLVNYGGDTNDGVTIVEDFFDFAVQDFMYQSGITKLEKRVIQNILNSEYMDAEGVRVIDWGVWSWTATQEKKSLAGALGSLVKKRICFSTNDEESPACGLTALGYLVAREMKLI